MARKRTESEQSMARSITVGVRLDPKLRYLAELAARKQRRSLSSFIEWVVQESLGRILLREGLTDNDPGTSIADEAAWLWDIDEADRFARLALRYPDLLTHEEQATWKLVRGNGYLWKGHYDKVTGEWTWRTDENALYLGRLREHWDAFKAVANGQADKSLLPAWVKQRPGGGPDELDDDIPF
jgi:hypothetical protein